MLLTDLGQFFLGFWFSKASIHYINKKGWTFWTVKVRFRRLKWGYLKNQQYWQSNDKYANIVWNESWISFLNHQGKHFGQFDHLYAHLWVPKWRLKWIAWARKYISSCCTLTFSHNWTQIPQIFSPLWIFMPLAIKFPTKISL